MKISGITMGKNVSKLYYPMKESIMSILPIVDEFIVVLGDSDEDDTTLENVKSINSDKIKIYQTVWDLEKYPRGMEHAHQTDIAKNYSSGDWIFYLQADEVIHEKYHEEIVNKCHKYLDDKEVEGFLFKYRHFWGDYEHYVDSHGWYKHEIRIVRNIPEIHSFESAQSFRRIPNFDGVSYREKTGTCKLKVVELDAYVYHYGWVRPLSYMKKKIKAFKTNHRGIKKVQELEITNKRLFEFDYGPLDRVPKFTGTHPAVMKEKMATFDWQDELQFSGKANPDRLKHKHERLKYRVITFIEKYILFGRELGGYHNFIRLKKK